VLLDSLAGPTLIGGAELHLVRINARFQTEVFDEFIGTVHARSREGIAVLDDIREALEVVYDEANSHGIFDVGELRRVFGVDYERLAIQEKGKEWLQRLDELDASIDANDLDGVEAHLAELRLLNRMFSKLSTERYLRSLGSDA
jgi:DNA-binding FadR family transcriptional regulator